MYDLDKAIRAAMMTAHRYARGGYAGGGGAESVLMQEMPTYDPMGNVSVPAFGPAPEQKPIAMENPERVRAAEDAARLAKEIQAFEASKAQIQAQPEWARMMTHAPQEPRARVQIEGGFIGNRQLGTAPYPVANALSGMAQGAYDFKTAPLYGLGAVFPPAAALGTALDTAEGVAAGSPTQVAMGAFGTPMKAVRNVIAPLTVASGLTAPDEAEAARAPRFGGLSAALSKTAPQSAEMSLQQALEMAKSIPARELSPLGFYSHGAEMAKSLPQAKGSPAQFKSTLMGEKYGVKPVEMEGFDEAFAGRPSVTRDEIASYFNERRPQIEETKLGTTHTPMSDQDFKANFDDLYDKYLVETGIYPKSEAQLRKWAETQTSPTRFERFTLPGGENYREIALTLPGKEVYRAPTVHSMGDEGDINRVAHLRMSDRTGPNGEKILHLEEGQSDWAQKARELRDDEVKRVMKEKGIEKKEASKLVPEDFGFKKPLDPKFEEKFSQARNASNEAMANHTSLVDRITQSVENRPDRTTMSPGEYNRAYDDYLSRRALAMNAHPEFEPSVQRMRQANNDLSKLKQQKRDFEEAEGVASGPYVKNTAAWTDLVLKRALREAAEGGYDKLIWTPGAEQAKRYSLSNHVDEVQYSPGRNGTHSVEAYKGNSNVFNKPNATIKEIADTFGQEIAEKIASGHGEVNRNTGYNVLSGLDLVTGGKGMEGYYDKIWPNQLSKLVKKLDPEVKLGRETLSTSPITPEQLMEQRTIPDQNQVNFHAIPITSKMREAIMNGQTDFARGGSIPFGPEAAQRAVQIAKQQAGRR